MPKVTKRGDRKRFMAQIPTTAMQVLRGAGRAGGKVIADEAKETVRSDEVREAITVRSSLKDDRIVVRISVKAGWARSVGTWLEYGTHPHFISVDEGQRNGRTVHRVNQQLRSAKGDASLVIGGKFVGRTVLHPGAKQEAFLRPALDRKESEAIATMQGYLSVRVTPRGFVPADRDDEA